MYHYYLNIAIYFIRNFEDICRYMQIILDSARNKENIQKAKMKCKSFQKAIKIKIEYYSLVGYNLIYETYIYMNPYYIHIYSVYICMYISKQLKFAATFQIFLILIKKLSWKSWLVRLMKIYHFFLHITKILHIQLYKENLHRYHAVINNT